VDWTAEDSNSTRIGDFPGRQNARTVSGAHPASNSSGKARLKRDGTRTETRFGLSAKRTNPFKLAGGGGQFSRLLAAEVCASAVVMVVMLDTTCSEVKCKTTGA